VASLRSAVINMDLTATELSALSIVWEKVRPGHWKANVSHTECLLRMNDFPEQPLFTVTVGGIPADIEDAPSGWTIKF